MITTVFLDILVLLIVMLLLFKTNALRRKLSEFKAKQADESLKQSEFYSVLTRWIEIHNAGKQISECLLSKGFRRVAIYGMKELGVLLLDELRNGGIDVDYGIDRDADLIYVKTKMVTPNEELEPVDAVIVTAIHYYSQIKKDLQTKLDCPIESLLDILYEMPVS